MKGRLQTRSWEDKTGEKKHRAEVDGMPTTAGGKEPILWQESSGGAGSNYMKSQGIRRRRWEELRHISGELGFW